MTIKKRDVLDPSGECVASTDSGNVSMRLLAVAWNRSVRQQCSYTEREPQPTNHRLCFPSNKSAVTPSCVSSSRRCRFATSLESEKGPEQQTQGFRPRLYHVVTAGSCGVLEPKFVFSRKVCVWPLSSCNILRIVICINRAVNTLHSRHVQRAVHMLPYFCRIYRSPVPWRPLRSEPNSARLRARTLTDVMLHARSATRCTIGRASSMQEGELQAE